VKHIAEIDNKEFFKDYFNNESDFDEFYKSIYSNDKAPKMLHQIARIISLADELGDYIEYRPAINLLFYIITAELVAKLFYDFEDEGRSKEYVKKFFNDFCTNNSKQKLSNSIIKDSIYLSFEDVIDFFYKIRCDVVHEGNYSKYSFNESDSDEIVYSNAELPNYKINIRIEEIRKIVIESSIFAIRIKIKK
jgi:hypothetical protein